MVDMDNQSSKDDNVVISGEERETIVRGFSQDFPKYSTQLMNIANQNAQSTRPPVVGQISELLEDFRKEHPNGDYQDWKEFYLEENDGEERLDEATEKLLDMLHEFRRVLDEIDEEMAKEYIFDLVLYKSYLGEDVEAVILNKLGDIYKKEVSPARLDSFDGFVGDQAVRIEPYDDYNKEDNSENIPIVYYKENKRDQSIELILSELSRSFGYQVKDDTAYRGLDNFSLSL